MTEFVVTKTTPRQDHRRQILEFAQERHHTLHSHGLIEGLRDGQPISMFQVVVGPKICRTRVNSSVRGIWIAAIRPYPTRPEEQRVDILLELPREERNETTHVTVVNGHLDGEPAWLVLWNLGSSVIRKADRDKLQTLLGRSVLVPEARGRYRQLLDEGLEPEEIRGYLWEAFQEGVHPEALGSTLVDRLEGAFRDGLPSRRTPVELVPLPEPERFGDSGLGDSEEAARANHTPASPRDIAAPRTEETPECLDDFDSRTQEVLRRKYMDGESQASIAKALGLSQPTVSRILKSAKDALRRRVSPPPETR